MQKTWLWLFLSIVTSIQTVNAENLICDFSSSVVMKPALLRLRHSDHGYTSANNENPARIWYRSSPAFRDTHARRVDGLSISGYDYLLLRCKWSSNTYLTIDLWFDSKMVDPRLFSYIRGNNDWQELKIPVRGAVLNLQISISESKMQAKGDEEELRKIFIKELVGITAVPRDKIFLPPAGEPIVIPEPKDVNWDLQTVWNVVKNNQPNARIESYGKAAILNLISKELIEYVQSQSRVTLMTEDILSNDSVRIVLDMGGQSPAAQSLSVNIPQGKEGYVIKTGMFHGNKVIVLAANDISGMYWSWQTFRQILHWEDGNLSVPSFEIRDWPDLEYRSMSGADKLEVLAANMNYKINVSFYPAWSPTIKGKWDNPPEVYRSKLTQCIAYSKKRGTDINDWVEPYDEASKKFITCSDPADIEAYYQTLKIGLDAGSRILTIGFDDQVRSPESFVSADRLAFGEDLKAHAYLVAQITNRVAKDFPDTMIFVIPKNYFNSNASDIKKYYDQAGVPKSVVIMWTGVSTITLTYRQDQIDSYVNGIEKRKFVIFDNTFVQTLGGRRRGFTLLETFADGYSKLIQTPEFFGFHMMASMNTKRGMLRFFRALLMSDYLWNARHYNSRRSQDRALAKIAGRDAVLPLLRFRHYMMRIASIYPVEIPLKKIEDERLLQYPLTQVMYLRFKDDLADAKKALNEIDQLSDNQKLRAELRRMYDRAITLLKKSWGLSRQQVLKQVIPNGNVSFDIKKEWERGKYYKRYDWQCSPRQSRAIYGRRIEPNWMQLRFILNDLPTTQAKLRLEAQDDDKPGKVAILIVMNGHTVFSGKNDFAQKGWSTLSFPLKPEWFKTGINQLKIMNLEDSDAYSSQWLMLAGSSIQF